MTNYRLDISYDGTRFYGWEHQPDRDTVQGRIENVVSRLAGADVEVIGAGRTDAGVHAKGMVANARFDCSLSCEEICAYLNRYLPDDICINGVSVASDRFHARYKAVGKLYTYTCYIGDRKPLFNRKYVWCPGFVPDTAAMQAAAAVLTGRHDFRSFCSNPNMKKTTVREVDSIEIIRKKNYLYLNFHGNGFLQNMVRIMTGTLLEAGAGRLSPEDIRRILEAKDRSLAGPTAPPEGLCLMKVDY